jgi:hypothetical protein
MHKKFILFALLIIFIPTTGSALASGLAETISKGCEKELQGYCKDVTPGEGRILACLYAHQDKLSGQCEYALYDVAAQLERAVAALTYVANECSEDIQKNCQGVRVGGGKVLECLEKNEKDVSDRCNQALEDVIKK